MADNVYFKPPKETEGQKRFRMARGASSPGNVVAPKPMGTPTSRRPAATNGGGGGYTPETPGGANPSVIPDFWATRIAPRFTAAHALQALRAGNKPLADLILQQVAGKPVDWAGYFRQYGAPAAFGHGGTVRPKGKAASTKGKAAPPAYGKGGAVSKSKTSKTPTRSITLSKGPGKPKTVTFKEGALHKQLGVPKGEKIPASKMAAARSGKLGPVAQKRALFAANVLTGGRKRKGK